MPHRIFIDNNNNYYAKTEAQEAGFADNKQVEAVKQSRQAQRQREIEHNFESYIEWIEETMTTEKEPYIQLIAVITGAEG
mgnify:CR=1 FL=1